jgi:acetyl esterase/lipase
MKIVIALIFAASAAFAQKVVPDYADVEYAIASGQSQKLDIYLPTAGTKPYPVVIWVHGGAWSGGDKNSAGTAVNWLLPEGYAIVSINYRLSGIATYPAQINDCKGAVRWIKAQAASYDFDTNRIGAWGSSAGGHLVALMGTTGDVGVHTIDTVSMDLEGATGDNREHSSRIQAVCDWYGPTDFLEIWKYPSGLDHDAPNSPESLLLGSPMLTVPERCMLANPITFITADDPPMIIMHGTKDNTVPFNQSELLDSALKQVYEPLGKEVLFYPIVDAGHGGGGFNADSTKQRVVSFFNKHLKSSPSEVSPSEPNEGIKFFASNSFVTVSSKGVLDRIEIVDLLGRIQYYTKPNSRELKIATTAFARGTYFLITYHKDQMFAYKFKV